MNRNASFVSIRSPFRAVLAALLLQGCQSYTIVQRNVFADDDGKVLYVEYGRSESDHVNTFVSAKGKTMDFKSKLMVLADFNEGVPDYLEVRDHGKVTNRIELSGISLKAWQCMNTLTRGTMYETDSGEWKLLANGFSTVVYHRTEDDPPRYLEVYRGVLCDTQQMNSEKDNRWHETMRRGREYKKPKPTKKE